jgi:hypothetical protein
MMTPEEADAYAESLASEEAAAERRNEEHFEYFPAYAYEEEQDMLRTLYTDPIWGMF